MTATTAFFIGMIWGLIIGVGFTFWWATTSGKKFEQDLRQTGREMPRTPAVPRY